MQGLRSISALLWAPDKVGVRQPLLILPPLLGTPENAGVICTNSALLWPPKKAGVR